MPKINAFSLNGKVCLVTGGAGLLGTAFSLACAENGATVLILDVNKKAGKKAASDIAKKTKNSQVFFYSCDITNPQEVKDALKKMMQRHRKIDALVNNAYPRNRNYGRKFEDVTYADFCENINTHLGGYFLITQQVAKVMKKQKSGIILNLGSIYGSVAPEFAVYAGTDMTTPVEYAAVKGAIVNLTRYLATYLGKYNIRVNTLSPGGVANNQPTSFVKRYAERVVLGNRMAVPEDLSGVLVFLLSDAARYMTGQNLIVDGGWTL